MKKTAPIDFDAIRELNYGLFLVEWEDKKGKVYIGYCVSQNTTSLMQTVKSYPGFNSVSFIQRISLVEPIANIKLE